MRGRICVAIAAAFVLCILAGPEIALAVGKDSGTGQTFLDQQVNPKALGTRVDGTITLYYEPMAVQGYWNKKVYTEYCPGDTRVRMSWFMRFNYNFANYGYSGNAEPFCFTSDMTSQSVAIRNFISTTVVPSLFGSPLLWEFKEVINFVQPAGLINGYPCCRDSLGGGFNGAMEFVIGDVAIAVQTK